jgi:hypothetical protein
MAARVQLRYVDPLAPRGPLYRAYVRFLGTRLAAWLSRHVVWKVADRVYPPYAAYRERAARAGRTIPLLQLVPR